MAEVIILDKSNLILGLEKILDYVKRWLKVKVEVEEVRNENKEDILKEYDFMRKIDEEMEKEWIKFERLSFEEGRRKFLENEEKIERFLKSLSTAK